MRSTSMPELYIVLAISTAALAISIMAYFRAGPKTKVLQLHQDMISELYSVGRNHQALLKSQSEINEEITRMIYGGDTPYKAPADSQQDKTSSQYKHPTLASQRRDQ